MFFYPICDRPPLAITACNYELHLCGEYIQCTLGGGKEGGRALPKCLAFREPNNYGNVGNGGGVAIDLLLVFKLATEQWLSGK